MLIFLLNCAVVAMETRKKVVKKKTIIHTGYCFALLADLHHYFRNM